jgi:hypothetical protein
MVRHWKSKQLNFLILGNVEFTSLENTTRATVYVVAAR